MVEQVHCKKCGDITEVQIGTEVHASNLCHTCFDEQEIALNNNHELYTVKDFKNWSGEAMEDSQLVRMVIDGGLSVCKICGEFEAGLDNPCKRRK